MESFSQGRRREGGFPNGKRGGASSEEEEEALIAPIPTKATPEWASVKWYLSAESVGAKVEGSKLVPL